MDPSKGATHLPILRVADFLVQKNIASDRDRARQVIFKNQSQRRENVTYDEFNRIFCKGLFKDALVGVTESINKQAANKEELPFALKVGEYQRSIMFEGLTKESKNHEYGKSILDALNKLRTEDSAPQREQRNDVARMKEEHEKMKQMMKEKRTEEKVDPFVKQIRIIDEVDSSHEEREGAITAPLRDEKRNEPRMAPPYQQVERDLQHMFFRNQRQKHSHEVSTTEEEGALSDGGAKRKQAVRDTRRPTLIGAANRMIRKEGTQKNVQLNTGGGS